VDELQILEQMLQEFLSGMQEALQSGERFSEEFQDQAAQYLTVLTTQIDRLMGQGAPPIPIDLDKSMDSSVIEAFKYDPKRNKLFVQFKGKYPNAQGSIYAYDNAPQEIFELFRRGAIPAKTKGSNRWGQWWQGKVPSMGSSMNVLLKGLGLPYQRLT
jgi:hypothetical protein